jgi:hypothetical protein
MVSIGAPLLMASIALRKSHGITLVMAEDATTIARPMENGIQYGL